MTCAPALVQLTRRRRPLPATAAHLLMPRHVIRIVRQRLEREARDLAQR